MSLAYLIADSVSTGDGVRLSTAILHVPREHVPWSLGGLCATRPTDDDRVLVTATGTVLRRWLETRRFGPLRGAVKDLERALDANAPAYMDLGDWHLPFIDGLALERAAEHVFDAGPAEGFMDFGQLTEAITQVTIQMSVARCLALDWCTEVSVQGHLDAYKSILKQGRFDAAEHQATPDVRQLDSTWRRPNYHGKIAGWQQCRKMIVGENLPQLQAAE